MMASEPPNPRKKMAPRSIVWKHFTRLAKYQDWCKCNYRGQEYECKSSLDGTSTLRNHHEKCEEYKNY